MFFKNFLQPYAENEFQLNSIGVGTLFLIDGFVYAVGTPLWGWLLDKNFKPIYALMIGNACCLLGYILLGPAPFLPFIPTNLYIMALALALQG